MTDIVAQIMNCCEQVINQTIYYQCRADNAIVLSVYHCVYRPQGGFVCQILFRDDHLVFPRNSYEEQLQPERGRTILYADPRLFELILETLDEYGGHTD